MTTPRLIMIAGPNGAGKTTSAMRLLPESLSIHEFINADEMARGLNPLNPDGQAVASGRLMLQRMDDLIAAKKSFAFETTGASRVFAEKMKRAKQDGYRIGLVYLWLPSFDVAKERVRLRVSQGGHNIPDADVVRRYKRGLFNLLDIYSPIADEVKIYDSSFCDTSAKDLVAQKKDASWDIVKSEVWEIIEQSTKEGAV